MPFTLLTVGVSSCYVNQILTSILNLPRISVLEYTKIHALRISLTKNNFTIRRKPFAPQSGDMRQEGATAMGNVYGYARCSTNESKQDIDRQIRDLKNMGATEIYHEYESGAKHNRPELTKLLSRIEEGDTIVTTEVSRITRSLKQLCDVIEFAKEKKLRLIIGNFVIDCSGQIDHMTQAMLQMMGVFSELERNMTIDRIKSGLANAKAKGVRLGRPKLKAGEVPKKVLEYWQLYSSGVITKTDYATLCGISRPTLYKYIALLTDS